jgi:hypothetical protein
MVKISLNLNVNSVVLLLNGFVGEQRISVNLATSDKLMEIMYLEKKRKICHSVVAQINVHLK